MACKSQMTGSSQPSIIPGARCTVLGFLVVSQCTTGAIATPKQPPLIHHPMCCLGCARSRVLVARSTIGRVLYYLQVLAGSLAGSPALRGNMYAMWNLRACMRGHNQVDHGCILGLERGGPAAGRAGRVGQSPPDTGWLRTLDGLAGLHMCQGLKERGDQESVCAGKQHEAKRKGSPWS